MEDRFKVRVYKKAEKQMVYDVTFLNPLIFDERINENASNYVVMQCTGLRDIKNKLIYDDDVVKIVHITPWGEEMEIIGKVYFDRCAYWINFKNSGELLYREDDTTYEVLGNVWETPELLESEE